MKQVWNQACRLRATLACVVALIGQGAGPGQTAPLPPGTILTVAGSGTAPDPNLPGWLLGGPVGKSGPATGAQLNHPSAVALDPAGNLILADTGNVKIRRVSPQGTIGSLISYAAHGLAMDAAGDIYAAVATHNSIQEYDQIQAQWNPVALPSGAANKLNGPSGVAVDGYALLIADTYNHRIRKLTYDGTLTTIAGSGPSDAAAYPAANGNVPDVGGFSGDGGPAAGARLDRPGALAVDLAGNVFIADTGNHRVRKVTPDGTISTFAGSGPGGSASAGFGGDGGPATQALLNAPAGLAIDTAGSVFIADTGNHRIRMVDAHGVISTVAGGGPLDPMDPTGAGATSAAGFSGDGGPATQARLNHPMGLTIDESGNLFVADTANERVREVAAAAAPGLIGGGSFATTVQSVSLTVDGVMRTALIFPGRHADVTPSPVVFSFSPGFTDAGNWADYQLLWKAWPEATFVYPQALSVNDLAQGGGSFLCWQWSPGVHGDRDVHFVDALLAELPNHVKVDPAHISATGWSCGSFMVEVLLYERASTIAAFVPDDGFLGDYIKWADHPAAVLDLMDTGPPGSNQGSGLVPAVRSMQTYALRRLDGCGDQTAPWLPGYDSYQPCAAGAPFVLHLAPGQHDWYPDFNAPVVKFLQAQALNPSAGGTPGVGQPLVDQAAGAIAGTGRVGSAGDGGPAVSAAFSFPEGAAVDGADNVYVADTGNGVVRRVSPDGVVRRAVGNGFDEPGLPLKPHAPGSAGIAMLDPTGMALDVQGNLYLTLTYRNLPSVTEEPVLRVAPNGIITELATWPAVSGLAVSPSGDIYVADPASHKVGRLSAAGGPITTVAGTGVAGYSGDGGPAIAAQLQNPTGLALDPSGNLYIADPANHAVRRLASDGTITTVAGNGVPGFSGDGGPAAKAQLNWPTYVVVDSQGGLFIADSFNGRVRRVTADGTITTVAGGDQAPGNATPLVHPAGLAIDRVGNLVIADPPGQRVKRLAGVAAPGLLMGRPFQAGDAAGPHPIGDMNGDGRFTLADVTLAFRAATGLIKPTAEQIAIGNLSLAAETNRITVADARNLLRMLLGLPFVY